MPDLIFDKIVSIDKQDGGQAKFIELNVTGTEDDEEGLFVRLQSWKKDGKHDQLDALLASGFTVIVRAK